MRFKHSKPDLVEPDWTPMIDMTFQLIAFFMVVINFEQTNADQRVKLPVDQLARPPLAPRESEVVLNVGFLRNPDGSLSRPGAYVFYGDESVPVREYQPRLQHEFQVAEQTRGEKAARETTIVVRADGDVPTGLIQELIRMGQEVGFSRFALKAGTDRER